MAREEQNRVLDLIERVTDGCLERETCPPWLLKPGKAECGLEWNRVQETCQLLTHMLLPSEMPPRERRRLDAIWTNTLGQQRAIEYDEGQHFNRFRGVTFQTYPKFLRLGCDKASWLSRCTTHEDLRGGGFSKPGPPLFPMDGGRNYQRAFRDMLADVLPPTHGWKPTLRIGYFEVGIWLYDDDAEERMWKLLQSKIG